MDGIEERVRAREDRSGSGNTQSVVGGQTSDQRKQHLQWG